MPTLERFTIAEPERAEAWFYLGAAYGVRAQLRVLREQRLAAARDGKVIKESLERALALDPSMDDAAFGVGMYRYYAAVAPAVLRMMRWLFLLPGGNRSEGLQQLERASQRGQLVRGEALYQIQIIYLWFEHKPNEALQILRDLQGRYPHNLHFRQMEAEVLDVYLHDRAASVKASEELLALALGRQVYRADIAEMRARLNLAAQWRALQQRDRATRAARHHHQTRTVITCGCAATRARAASGNHPTVMYARAAREPNYSSRVLDPTLAF